jgi:hypothetical protein
LLFDEIGLGGGQIDLINDRQNGEVVGGGKKGVGDGLRLDALAGVHDQQSAAFAGRQGARNFSSGKTGLSSYGKKQDKPLK